MSIHLDDSQGIRLAVEGCGHGTLHAIYASIEAACQRRGWPGIDLLIIGGDFQSVRNAYDLNCVSMPAKYRAMCDFHEYYSGHRTAPYLTVFVGGNHEASNYLLELYYGGWVAPNIYYMGAANVLRLGPVRIAGLSGIWKGFDYRKPHLERLPFSESDMRSIYHVRELDVRKLLQVRTQVDVGISHDWPRGVEWEGDWKKLFRQKKHFEDDARSGRLGSVAAKYVVEHLRPKYWFSAHLHCKFAAVISHETHDVPQQALPTSNGAAWAKNPDEIDLDLSEDDTDPVPVRNPDEIDLDLAEDEPATTPNAMSQPPNGNVKLDPNEIDLDLDEIFETPTVVPTPNNALPTTANPNPAQSTIPAPVPAQAGHLSPDITNLTTNFLALDKCLPNRDFLQLTLLPSASAPARPLKLAYDREWLSVTRAFALAEPPTFGDAAAHVPAAKSPQEYQTLISAQRAWIDERFPLPVAAATSATADGESSDDDPLLVPENFERVAPVYDGGNWQLPQYQAGGGGGGPREYADPQTAAFCRMLEIANPLELDEEAREQRMAAAPRPEPDAGGFWRGRGGRGFGGGRGGGRGGRGFRGRGRGGGFRGR